MEQALLKKKIMLDNKVTDETYVKGDSNMIELIIRNLVSNAIKFSDHGGKLELYAENHQNEVVLSIKDNGVGMTENKVQKINSTSSHSLESTYGTDKEKGTGLGLMLCKHFAGIMGGSITVKSKPGSGSLFNISLPSAAA
jgi:signal transduction histidine kinase